MVLFSPAASYDLPCPEHLFKVGCQAVCRASGSSASMPYSSLVPGVSLGISMFPKTNLGSFSVFGPEVDPELPILLPEEESHVWPGVYDSVQILTPP